MRRRGWGVGKGERQGEEVAWQKELNGRRRVATSYCRVHPSVRPSVRPSTRLTPCLPTPEHQDFGARTDEYRVGFLCSVFAMEDAKSEIFKIFQEAWEKEQGYEWEDMGPPVMKYAEDILK